MTRRTRKIHVTANDAARILDLATLIEDRDPSEHDALIRAARKLDRSEGVAEGDVGVWERRVLETRIEWDDDGEPLGRMVEDVRVSGGAL